MDHKDWARRTLAKPVAPKTQNLSRQTDVVIRVFPFLVYVLVTLATSAPADAQAPQDVDWPGVGNDPGCMRYSTLDQINRDNVHQLIPSWTYRTGELQNGEGKTIECTPIVVDGVMYVTTGRLRVVALDAASG